ncbi:hypothetical protein SAY87_008273 [Trapa incisa]|uniref:Pantothenate kinase n=1 Tax=Trapa incisa TaxID=236973 RepID=A0AAN7KGF9_9MYRT|nr:hypothetical protein SAY87_008273 [Trapa incisa]
MAGPTGDYPYVLGSNDIDHREEETIGKDRGLDKLVEVGAEESHGFSAGVAGRDMAPSIGGSIHLSSSRPQLDLSKAEIQGNFEERDPTILLPNQSDDISHLAVDIGGSLIKLVYFSRHEDHSNDDDKRKRTAKQRLGITNGRRRSYPILGGRLHFVKFETSKINKCLDFIHSKQLHRGGMDSLVWGSESPSRDNAVIKATGGGAYKFADLYKERLGVSLDKEDEMG